MVLLCKRRSINGILPKNRDPTICNYYAIMITENTIRARIAEIGHFLQITISRKTLQFLKKNYTISSDRELQKQATFCKSQSQGKLYNFSGKISQILNKSYTISSDCELQKLVTFCRSRSQGKLYNLSRKTIQFLANTNCRNWPLSVKSRSQEKL